MTQHSDNHLTTEQLSAMLDQQLTGEERATCEAHLRSCPLCQSALADLRQTVSLLHALPAPEPPRSFALPTNVTYIQERAPQRAAPLDTPSRPSLAGMRQRRPTPITPLRRSTRILSALVAIIGLFFLLPTILGMVPHFGAVQNSSSSGSAAVPSSAPQHTPAIMGPNTASPGSTKGANRGVAGTMSPARRPSPTPSASPTAASSNTRSSEASEKQPPLPVPNLATPLGQQEVGFALLVLGILGLLLTRRRRTTP